MIAAKLLGVGVICYIAIDNYTLEIVYSFQHNTT